MKRKVGKNIDEMEDTGVGDKSEDASVRANWNADVRDDLDEIKIGTLVLTH